MNITPAPSNLERENRLYSGSGISLTVQGLGRVHVSARFVTLNLWGSV